MRKLWFRKVFLGYPGCVGIANLYVVLVTQLCPIPCDHMDPATLLCTWDSPGKATGVGCHSLLHGIFPTKGSNTGPLNCRWILYRLSHRELLSTYFFLIIDLLQSTTDTYLTTTDFAIQFSSVSQWCLTLCNPVDKSYRFGYLMPVSTKPHAAFTSIVTYHYQATHGTLADLLSHTVFAAKKGIACSLL